MSSIIPVVQSRENHGVGFGEGASMGRELSPAPFSRASHFALILLPVTLAVAVGVLGAPGSPALVRAIAYFTFLLGLGGAVATLYFLGMVEDRERNG